MALATTDRDIEALYRAGPAPELVEIPELNFLMIDGHGDPNGSRQYEAAIQALYGVSYTLKFACKRAGGPDYRVPPLEGLWWAEDMSSFTQGDKTDWLWTAMIRQPFEMTAAIVEQAATEIAAKKHLPVARALRLERFAKGRCAQILHVGPYSAEALTIERLHAFIEEQGCDRRGKHHEIYLGDPDGLHSTG